MLRNLGSADLMHASHVPFLSHLVGTRRVLAQWESRSALCDAGLFHSAYGTEYFTVETPASRNELRQLIGDEAEQIVWLWCTIVRDTIEFDQPAGAIDRFVGDQIELDEQTLTDIATLWAADTVEQIGRMTADERGFAHGLPRMLHYATPRAREAVQEVLASLRRPG